MFYVDFAEMYYPQVRRFQLEVPASNVVLNEIYGEGIYISIFMEPNRFNYLCGVL